MSEPVHVGEGRGQQRPEGLCGTMLQELPRDGGKAWRRHIQRSEFSSGGWRVTVAHRIEFL